MTQMRYIGDKPWLIPTRSYGQSAIACHRTSALQPWQEACRAPSVSWPSWATLVWAASWGAEESWA